MSEDGQASCYTVHWKHDMFREMSKSRTICTATRRNIS